MPEETFEQMFENAKSVIWFENPSDDEILQMMARVLRLATCREQFRRIEIIFSFSRLARVRARFYSQFEGEIETLRYITCSA